MTNESGSPDDELVSSMQAAEQIRAAEAPQDTQHRCARIEEAYAKSRYAPMPEHEDALRKLAGGEGDPLELAKILRPGAHLLETWPATESRRASEIGPGTPSKWNAGKRS
jgi:hypothetical protein